MGHDYSLGKKKGLTFSLRQLKLFFPKDMIIPWGKINLPQGNAQVP
jgi:hypothetical protein